MLFWCLLLCFYYFCPLYSVSYLILSRYKQKVLYLLLNLCVYDYPKSKVGAALLAVSSWISLYPLGLCYIKYWKCLHLTHVDTVWKGNLTHISEVSIWLSFTVGRLGHESFSLTCCFVFLYSINLSFSISQTPFLIPVLTLLFVFFVCF